MLILIFIGSDIEYQPEDARDSISIENESNSNEDEDLESEVEEISQGIIFIFLALSNKYTNYII